MNTYNNRKPIGFFSIKALMVTVSMFINNASAGKFEFDFAIKGVRKAMQIKKNLLVVNTSPNLDSSQSRALSRHFVQGVEKYYPGGYAPLYRDLEKDPIPYIRKDSLEVITSGRVSTLEAKKLKSLSDTLITEIEKSDAIVIATPMHNFTIPAVLKAYFDLVLFAGRTFKYTSNGPEGMLTDRPVTVISSSGGCYHGTEKDFLTPYVKHVLGFMGIKNCTFVVAEGLAMKDLKEISLMKAREKLETHIKTFHQ